MEITNITDYNVSLINGETIKPHETIYLYKKGNEVLENQIKILESKNVLMVRN